MYTMCTSRSCTLVKENGFNTAYVIAHEAGHAYVYFILNMVVCKFFCDTANCICERFVQIWLFSYKYLSVAMLRILTHLSLKELSHVVCNSAYITDL